MPLPPQPMRVVVRYHIYIEYNAHIYMYIGVYNHAKIMHMSWGS